MNRRIFSAVLTLALLLGLCPVTAFAVTIVDSGTCGENLTWTLDDAGTLTISGTGKMDDWNDSDIPWIDDMSSIRSVLIENNITSIGDFAFYGCNNLTSISIPNSVKNIGYVAFYDCISLANINIPNSVTFIGDSAFAHCNIKKISIPNNISSIGRGLFLWCQNLTDVEISSGILSVGSYAFQGCISITNIDIPNSVTSIEEGAFYYCENLSSVSIPNSIEFIEEAAFGCCPKLKDVYYSGSESQWNAISIENEWNENDDLLNATIHYNSSAPSSPNSITPINFGTITINHAGTGIAHFKVTDENGNPQAGARFLCTLTAAPFSPVSRDVVSDGNGILSVETPEVTKDQTFTATFSPVGSATAYTGTTQTVEVEVQELSYTQTWKGGIDIGGELSVSLGVGGKAGVASAEASLAKAAIAGKAAGSIEITDEYEDGKRTFTYQTALDGGIGGKIKSGIDADVISKVKLTVVGGSAKGLVSTGTTSGIKIAYYDPENVSQQKQLGKFILNTSLLSMPNSLFADRLSGLLSDPNCNQVGTEVKVVGNGDSSVLNLKIGEDNGQIAFGSLAGIDASILYGFSTNADETEQTITYQKTFVSSGGAGIGSGVSIGNQDNTKGPKLSADYIWGGSVSNHKELTAKTDCSGNPKELSYKVYNGDETSLFWKSESTDTYAVVSCKDDAVLSLIENNADLNRFTQGHFFAIGIQDGIDAISSAGEQATVTETETHKIGIDFEFPLGISLGAGAEIDFGIVGENNYSYTKENAVMYQGNSYVTSRTSDSVADKIKSQKKSLGDIVTEPLSAVWDSIKDKAVSVYNDIKNGVENACAKVTGTVSGWYASVTSVFSDDSAVNSYAVLALMGEEEPDSNAAVAVTIGDPYTVAVYADEAGEIPVTDAELEEHPLTLALSYTDEMLTAAGAAAEDDIRIFRYDAARNVYLCVPDCTHDPAAKTVTAQITKQGEYILAVDTAAPCITDFAASDETAAPVLTALVSDMSGIADFTFQIDGATCVTEETLNEYYNEITGVFRYPVATALTPGTHTAAFQAADALGNALTAPVSFSFTVQEFEGEITYVTVPTEPVTEDAFSVTAEMSDCLTTAILYGENTDGESISTFMTLTDGVWTGTLTGLSGTGTLSVYVVAADDGGNSVKSETKTVTVNHPAMAEEISMSISKVTTDETGTAVEILLTNGTNTAVSGILNAAFYDSNGKQLGIVQTGTGLNPGTEETKILQSTVTSADHVKVFWMDTGYKPLCESAEQSL